MIVLGSFVSALLENTFDNFSSEKKSEMNEGKYFCRRVSLFPQLYLSRICVLIKLKASAAGWISSNGDLKL